MSEIPFEYLLIALESTRGTAVDPPTHYANIAGKITPKQDRYYPEESRGTIVEAYRSKTVRRWSELEGEGPLDNFLLPVWAHMAIDGSVTPTTPVGGTTSRLWTFVPTITSDDIDSATVYWGDPNVQAFQAAYMMLDEIGISADSGGTDGVMMSVKGMGNFPSKTAPASVPAQLTSPLFTPNDSQLWIDTATIGTTEVTNRMISSELTIQTGVTYKWVATGPSGGMNFVLTGRKRRRAELKVVLELPDMTEYDQFANNDGDTTYKVRLRHNGPLIEGTLYHYVEFDIYGALHMEDWGDYEDSNRTIELSVRSEYDTTLAADFALKVQNTRTTL